jgi:hypothetical protein
VQPNEIPGRRNPEESRLPARANYKTFANGSKIIAHAWLTPENFSFCTRDQVNSSYYSPQSKERNPQQAEQGHAQMQQCV